LKFNFVTNSFFNLFTFQFLKISVIYFYLKIYNYLEDDDAMIEYAVIDNKSQDFFGGWGRRVLG
jgi:hypothetical protein